MSRIGTVARSGRDLHDVHDVTADDGALLRDMATYDHQHRGGHRPRRRWTVARTGGPGLAAPRREVAFLEALECGRRPTGAERILLPPLGAPPVRLAARNVLQVTDYEGPAARSIGQPDHVDGVRRDRARQVDHRGAQSISPGQHAAVAECRLTVGIGRATPAPPGIRSLESAEVDGHIGEWLAAAVCERR